MTNGREHNLANVIIGLVLFWQYSKLAPAQKRWVRVYFAFGAFLFLVYAFGVIATGIIVGSSSISNSDAYVAWSFPAMLAMLVGLWYVVFRLPARCANSYIRNHPRNY